MQKTGFVGFRLDEDREHKLERLAKESRRSKSQVLRLLIDAAVVDPKADIWLRQSQEEEA